MEQWFSERRSPVFASGKLYRHHYRFFRAVPLTSPQPILVNQPPPFVINEIEEVQPSCFGDSNGELRLLVNGGTPSYHFKWITGDTTPFLQNIATGNYSCTITDDNGCVIQSGEIVLEQPDELVVDTVNTAISDAAYCLPNSGSVILSVEGGIPPYNYFWSNGARSEDLLNVGAGQYFCNIEDVNGCLLQTPDYEIDITDSLKSTPVATPDIDGQGNGTATFSIIGGQGPYQFLWDNGQTDSVITDLSFGTYFLTITDRDGCTRVDSIEVEFSVNTSTLSKNGQIKLFPNPARQQIILDVQFSDVELITIELLSSDGRKLRTRQFGTAASSFREIIDLQKFTSWIVLYSPDCERWSF